MIASTDNMSSPAESTRSASLKASETSSGTHGHQSNLTRQSVGRPSVITRPPFAHGDSVDISTYGRHTKPHMLPPATFGIDTPAESPLPEKRPNGKGKSVDEVSSPSPPPNETDESGSGWWTFIRAAPLLKQIGDYIEGNEEERSHKRSGDVEKADTEKKAWGSRRSSHHSERSQDLADGDQPNSTPGWLAPWAPLNRTNSSPWFRVNFGPSEGLPTGVDAGAPRAKTFMDKVNRFFLYSPFAPFWLRLINLIFTCTALGVAARQQVIMVQHDLAGIIGQSTIFALIITPATIVHVFVNLYLEYFGAPIGIWPVRTKMAHTLIELVFITLYAAELSLAFEDYFSTPATCTQYTPNARFRGTNLDPDIYVSELPVAKTLCHLQQVLLCFIFFGLLAYQAVLVISLFRIFNKVARKG